MALINCFECNKKVSDTAKTCPHCGLNVKKQVFYKRLQNNINDEKIMARFILICYLIIMVVVLLCCFISYVLKNIVDPNISYFNWPNQKIYNLTFEELIINSKKNYYDIGYKPINNVYIDGNVISIDRVNDNYYIKVTGGWTLGLTKEEFDMYNIKLFLPVRIVADGDEIKSHYLDNVENIIKLNR